MALENIKAPMTGRIISVNVKPGDQIAEWDVICLLESMKMENPILAPVSGMIKEISISPGQVAKTGDVIAIIEY